MSIKPYLDITQDKTYNGEDSSCRDLKVWRNTFLEKDVLISQSLDVTGDLSVGGNVEVVGDLEANIISGSITPDNLNPGATTNSIISVDDVGNVGFNVYYRSEDISAQINYVADAYVFNATIHAERIGNIVTLSIPEFTHIVVVGGDNFVITGLPSWVLPLSADSKYFVIPFENGASEVRAIGFVTNTIIDLCHTPAIVPGSGGLNFAPGSVPSNVTITYNLI